MALQADRDAFFRCHDELVHLCPVAAGVSPEFLVEAAAQVRRLGHPARIGALDRSPQRFDQVIDHASSPSLLALRAGEADMTSS
jgi:hypothetical protein